MPVLPREPCALFFRVRRRLLIHLQRDPVGVACSGNMAGLCSTHSGEVTDPSHVEALGPIRLSMPGLQPMCFSASRSSVTRPKDSASRTTDPADECWPPCGSTKLILPGESMLQSRCWLVQVLDVQFIILGGVRAPSHVGTGLAPSTLASFLFLATWGKGAAVRPEGKPA